MPNWPQRLTPLDKLLGLFTSLRPGEGRSVVVFFSYALLMMLSYYILKTIREPLLLAGSGAEMKSYAAAVIAVILLFLVPLYGMAFRQIGKDRLTQFVTCFFLVILFIFFLLGRSGADIGFAYYVWIGLFSVLITAQFWAFAADNFNVKSGQRLFPLIMVGATLGSLLAPAMSGWLFQKIGPWSLMSLSMGLLALTLPLVNYGKRCIPPGTGPHQGGVNDKQSSGFWSGINLVLSDRYLLLLAILMVLLNWVNTTGEYILADLVVRHADAVVATTPGADKSKIIAAFYGTFFSIVNLLTLVIQVFLVARVLKWLGVRGAVLVLPVIAIFGYGLVVFVPIFSILRIVKILENSTDYSLMNTTRHALYLPLSPAKKYEGKTTIEAFFWRCGDLAQAGAIYAGLHWFNFELKDFALFNMVLAMAWLFVAWQVGRHYHAREEEASKNLPPMLVHPIEDRVLEPGTSFEFELPYDTFVDPDEGDVLRYSAHAEDQRELPRWLHFSPEKLRFRGEVPADLDGTTRIIVAARDFDGARVHGLMTLIHNKPLA
jgi:AAA family ATP:ADP antiporter